MSFQGEKLSCLFEMKSCGLTVSDDGWEISVPRHIQTWKAATSYLSERIYCLEKKIRVAADWTPALKRYEYYYKVMQEVTSEVKLGIINQDTLKKFPDKPITIGIDATAEIGDFDYLYSTIASFLHDMFVIMNLSDPGCCDFYRARLIVVPTGRFHYQPSEISLSSHNFECAVLDGNAGKLPFTKVIPVEKTAGWYFSIRNDISQIAKKRMEKVLFALMHLAKGDLTLGVIIWLFYALEQLFATKVGENRAGLENRLRLLLSPHEKESSVLKKKLRELYDYRSSIVHGGLEIIHVMEHDVLGDAVDNSVKKLMELSEFGFSLLLVSLQELIFNGWHALSFREVLQGDEQYV